MPELRREEVEKVATAIAEAGNSCVSETELQMRVHSILADFGERAGISLEGEHNRTIGSGGRPDSRYGRIDIEYKEPKKLRGQNSYGANKAAIRQVEKYLEEIAEGGQVELPRLLGVCTDGRWIIFVKWRRGEWEEEDPRAVDRDSVGLLLRRLVSLGLGRPMTAGNLVSDFGAGTELARDCLRAFYEALTSGPSRRTTDFLGQWVRFFGQACGFSRASAALDKSGLGEAWGIDPARVSSGHIFAIYTYYALLMKLLAAEIAHRYHRHPSHYLRGLGSESSEGLRRKMTELERGGVFPQLGIKNFLEGDLFSWYLEEWNGGIYEAVGAVAENLESYDPLTLGAEPGESRDLLKRLYELLLPKKLRHDLGEYYTPDWLAELVLDEVGYKGDPDERVLDPACGSGTFLVLAIQRAKEFMADNSLGEREVLGKILRNVVGFDLNPLAVVAARTNYLMALGPELLSEAPVEGIEIPVYLCDSIRLPEHHRVIGEYEVMTEVGAFAVPETIVQAGKVGELMDLLGACAEQSYPAGDFLARAEGELGLGEEFWTAATSEGRRSLVVELYRRLVALQEEDRNGIWARIVKNQFAPVFKVAEGGFDYVVGNPPWINWESLPDEYRESTKAIWQRYGLFTLKGWRARMGGGKKDLAMLFAYVGLDRYAKENGKLGFVITQTVFKTKGAGEGFRRFRLGASGEAFKVERVHDLVEIKPFAGAANRTAVFRAVKGARTEYPVPYIVWRKNKGARVTEDMSLEQVKQATGREEQEGRPIALKMRPDGTIAEGWGSPWATGTREVVQRVEGLSGRSRYKARAGCCTWLNGVYWVQILERYADGTVLVENLHDVGKKKVERLPPQRIEGDLVYPLLRGRDVSRWRAEPSAHILMVQDPEKRVGYGESWMRRSHPLAYEYLKRFEEELRLRSGYKKYFDPKVAPFYSMYNVGPYTFAEWKVVWPDIATDLRAAVVGPEGAGRVVVPDHRVMLVRCEAAGEAYFLAGLLNSRLAIGIAGSYTGGGTFSPHVLEHIPIPKYDSSNAVHVELSRLSEEAHRAKGRRDGGEVKRLEGVIDEIAERVLGCGQGQKGQAVGE